ncbi:MAG: hypothetical protein UDB11_09960 [Peptococcaceae bacterium]|nr:hypothetical protein [Peptococcaceae bacterium]
MYLSFFCGTLCMIVGILIIGSAFLIQRKEDKVRPSGYYTQADILVNKPSHKKDGITQNLVKFRFTKDFKVLLAEEFFPSMEAEKIYVGRKYFVIYDEDKDKVYLNPMAKYRKKQSVLVLIGGIVLLLGINWSMVSYGFIL